MINRVLYVFVVTIPVIFGGLLVWATQQPQLEIVQIIFGIFIVYLGICVLFIGAYMLYLVFNGKL